VRVRAARVNRVLGSDLAPGEMVDLLAPIGFEATPVTGKASELDVVVPSWRYDSATEIDVVEEVGRMHGYSALGKTLPASAHTGRLTGRQQERRRLRTLLAGLGLSEALPLPFLAPGQLERCGLPGDGIEIANPLVAEESILRTSLLPGLVGALATNAARRNTGVRLWEIGHVFRRPGGDGTGADIPVLRDADRKGASSDDELPDEGEALGVALGGGDAADAVQVWRAVEESLVVEGVRVVNAELAGMVVAPVRCATPGIEVLCTGKPACAAADTIHCVNTPPPSPPSAAINIVIGRVEVMLWPRRRSRRTSRSPSAAADA
jgi:phenylalanyl-tRNA synthetase beta chain